MNNLEDLKKLLDEKGQRVSEATLLFLDMSSECTGWATYKVDFLTKSARADECGAIWFNKDFTNQDKLHYLYNSITSYFNIVKQIDYCCAESFMVNAKRLQGTHISIQLHGALAVGLAEIGLTYNTIPVPTWRKELGIKPIITEVGGKKKRDYKTPAADLVNSKIKVPEKVLSNVTNNLRETPDDLTDAICLGWAKLKMLGVRNIDFSGLKFQTHVGVMTNKGEF